MNSGLFTLPLASLDRQSHAAAGSPCAVAEPVLAFIAGDENALIRVLAEAAISQPLSYNPIVLYGPPGVGKSSVAHALASLRRNRFSLNSVIATTAIDCARALAHALETSSEDDFRHRYHECDLLLIDDLDGIADRLPAQRFLLGAIDALLARGIMVLVTSRQPPQATPSLLVRLSSRLSGGLVVAVSPPGYEARCELIRRMAARHCLKLNDEQIRRIVGARGGLSDRTFTAGKIQEAVLKLAARSDSDPAATDDETEIPASLDCHRLCRLATTLVARHYGLPPADLKRPTRRKTVAAARGLAMYLVRALAGASYSSIGKSFGGRDHTTVLHACRKLSAAIENDASLQRLVDDLALQLAAEGGL